MRFYVDWGVMNRWELLYIVVNVGFLQIVNVLLGEINFGMNFINEC